MSFFIRDVVVDETHEHKHQRDEDGNNEERRKIRPICGVPKAASTIVVGKKNEIPDSAGPHRRSRSPPSSDRRGRQILVRTIISTPPAMILLIVVRFFIRANTGCSKSDRRKWR